MSELPDFSDTEVEIVHATVNERYGKDGALQRTDAEIRLDPAARSLTTVPAVFRAEGGSNFVIFKLGENRFRSQFFYRGYQQFGTGHELFDDIGDCVLATLRVEADRARDASEAAD
jgi:hypothetical protein